MKSTTKIKLVGDELYGSSVKFRVVTEITNIKDGEGDFNIEIEDIKYNPMDFATVDDLLESFIDWWYENGNYDGEQGTVTISIEKNNQTWTFERR